MIVIYKCEICGKVSVSLGFLHGHIERHRKTWKFWKYGGPEFLMDNTKILKVEETSEISLETAEKLNAIK